MKKLPKFKFKVRNAELLNPALLKCAAKCLRDTLDNRKIIPCMQAANLLFLSNILHNIIPSHHIKCVARWLMDVIFKHCRIKDECKVPSANSFDSFRGISKNSSTGLHEFPHCDVGRNARCLEVRLGLTISGNSVLDLCLAS